MNLATSIAARESWFPRVGREVGLALAIFLGGATASAVVPSLIGQPASADSAQPALEECVDDTLGVDAEPWARSELYFGTAKPDGTAVSEADWNTFLDEEITPRFPAGLTVLSGSGQWQEEDGTIVEERSKLVILFYPREVASESGVSIEAIRAAYEERFQQESVLRADDSQPAPACVSF